MIEKYPDKPWDWSSSGLSSNPSLTMRMIEQYLINVGLGKQFPTQI